jgi:hypothetical protein
MKTIHKYPFKIDDEQIIKMPICNCDVIHVGLDPVGVPCIWAIVDPNQPICDVPLAVRGTGHAVPSTRYKHIGSFIDYPCMWHVFLFR